LIDISPNHTLVFQVSQTTKEYPLSRTIKLGKINHLFWNSWDRDYPPILQTFGQMDWKAYSHTQLQHFICKWY